MIQRIHRELKVLVGLPLRDAGRAASLEWFEFGPRIVSPAKQDSKAAASRPYVLDTENAWHIARSRGRVVVASQDRLYPAGDDPYAGLEDFDWDRPGVNRCDERMKNFLDAHKEHPLVVQSVEASNWGGLKVVLTRGYVLEIFTNTSLDSEYWRLFERSNTRRHFVVTAHGIEH